MKIRGLLGKKLKQESTWDPPIPFYFKFGKKLSRKCVYPLCTKLPTHLSYTTCYAAVLFGLQNFPALVN